MIINEPVFLFGILLALVFFGFLNLGRLQDWIAGKIHKRKDKK